MSDKHLTDRLQTASLYELLDMVAEESKRDAPRPYVVQRIMSRIAKRMARELYTLPVTTPIRKGETVGKYMLRLTNIALTGEDK